MKRSAEGGGPVAWRSRHRVLINLVRFLGYIAAPTAPSATPFDLPYPQLAPGRAPVCTHTVGCTPNDIIVITHYLTSEATLQMILGSRARSAFHYGAAVHRYYHDNDNNNKTVRPLAMRSAVPQEF